jgi:Ca2+-binding RTX toxin-like protein
MAIINGTTEDDAGFIGPFRALVGTNGNDEINGWGGNDQLFGNGGNDVMDGGTCDDYLRGGDGNDTLYGGAGAGYDRLYGDDGNDTLYGGQGPDSLFGGNGADLLYGEDGDDYLSGDAGHDRLFGGDGHDTLLGGDGNDFLHGGDGFGRDLLWGGNGNDTILAGAGGDTIDGGAGYDVLDMRQATSSVTIDPAQKVVSGGGFGTMKVENVECFLGSSHADAFVGGNETVFFGYGGNDYVQAGPGIMILHGGDGVDTLDFTRTGSGIQVNLATNVTGGAAANKTISGFEDVYGTSAADVIVGNSAANRLNGQAGDDHLSGGADNDQLDGDAGNDYLDGGSGSDVLFGRTGNDHLSGGDGNDRLTGGAGQDSLAGGAGQDNFVYTSKLDSKPGAGNRDQIADFLKGTDKIDLAAVDGNDGVSGNQALAWRGTQSFNAAGQARYYHADGNTVVEVNTAGSGGAEMEIVLLGTHNLAAGDFWL